MEQSDANKREVPTDEVIKMVERGCYDAADLVGRIVRSETIPAQDPGSTYGNRHDIALRFLEIAPELLSQLRKQKK